MLYMEASENNVGRRDLDDDRHPSSWRHLPCPGRYQNCSLTQTEASLSWTRICSIVPACQNRGLDLLSLNVWVNVPVSEKSGGGENAPYAEIPSHGEDSAEIFFGRVMANACV